MWELESIHCLSQALANFFCEDSNSKYFKPTGYTVPLTTIQLCQSNGKAAIDNTEIRPWLYSNKTLFIKTERGPIWLVGWFIKS